MGNTSSVTAIKGSGTSILQDITAIAHLETSLDKLLLDNNELIYKGEATTAVYACVQDAISKRPLACKIFNEPVNEKLFWHELLFVRKLNHPNIVSLQGYVTTDRYAILYDYSDIGTLHDLLHSPKHQHLRPLNLELYFQFAKDIAHALAYINSLGFLHRKLSSKNIVVKSIAVDAEKVNLLITDFAYNSSINQQSFTPTAYATSKFSTLFNTLDVYAFGVLLWEMLTGTIPSSYYPSAQSEELPIPSSCPEELANIIRLCWKEERPPIQDVLVELMQAEKKLLGKITQKYTAVQEINLRCNKARVERLYKLSAYCDKISLKDIDVTVLKNAIRQAAMNLENSGILHTEDFKELDGVLDDIEVMIPNEVQTLQHQLSKLWTKQGAIKRFRTVIEMYIGKLQSVINVCQQKGTAPHEAQSIQLNSRPSLGQLRASYRQRFDSRMGEIPTSGNVDLSLGRSASAPIIPAKSIPTFGHHLQTSMQNNFQDTTQDRDRLESRHTIQTPENLKRPASASAIPSENDDFDTEYTDIPVPNAQSPPPTPTTVTTQEPLVTYSNSTPDDNANNLLDELSWDTGAKVFWHSYFGNSTVVTWEKFITALELRLSLQPADKRNLKKIIDRNNSQQISIQTFAQFLHCNGPLETCISKLNKYASQPWFHWYLNHYECSVLMTHSEAGTFMVRFSDKHPGSLAISLKSESGGYNEWSLKSSRGTLWADLQSMHTPVFNDLFSLVQYYMQQGYLRFPFVAPWTSASYVSSFEKLYNRLSDLSQSWFRGLIDGQEAVNLLQGCPIGTFLIRLSANGNYFVCVVVVEEGILQEKVIWSPGEFTVDCPWSSPETFACNSLEEFIAMRPNKLRFPYSDEFVKG